MVKESHFAKTIVISCVKLYRNSDKLLAINERNLDIQLYVGDLPTFFLQPKEYFIFLGLGFQEFRNLEKKETPTTTTTKKPKQKQKFQNEGHIFVKTLKTSYVKGFWNTSKN